MIIVRMGNQEGICVGKFALYQLSIRVERAEEHLFERRASEKRID
jgi:hypothetical protein